MNDRIDTCNSQEIGHDGVGGRSATGAADAQLPCLFDDFVDDQKKFVQLQLANHAQFLLQLSGRLLAQSRGIRAPALGILGKWIGTARRVR